MVATSLSKARWMKDTIEVRNSEGQKKKRKKHFHYQGRKTSGRMGMKEAGFYIQKKKIKFK